MTAIPSNVRFLDEAERELLELEGHQQRQAIKAIQKIAREPGSVGKPLGSHHGADATGLRSTRVDKGNLRIVWLPVEGGQVRIALICAVGSRGDEQVYTIAARRRAEALDLSRLNWIR